MLPFGITLKEPDLMQSCRMTVDEQPYYNPSSAPFCIEQPLALPDEETFRQRKQNSESAPERMTPGCESMQIFALMYQSARKRALAEMENWKRDDGLEPLLPHLVEQCFKTGIPEEEAVQRTLMHYFHATDIETIRTAFGNGYREMKGFGKKSGFSKEQEATFRLEEFLKRRYEFRFNTVLDEVEYRQRDSVHFYFKPLDKRTRNSIALCALKEGLQVWDRDIDRFLTSDFVPLYNPVEEYLCDLPRWDGTQKDLLTDPTGSRRFICIEVTDPIDTNVTIDYRQLYAQAMHLLYKNERYWLNDEDEAVLRQSNSEFEQISPLEHLFHCNFSSATNEKEGEWMTAMDIFNYLQENTRDKLSINKINWFGRILRKLNIPKKTSTRGTLYHVTKLK